MTMSNLAPAISTALTIVASKNQISCDLTGEQVILNLKSGIYFGLDPVGSRIWSLIQEPNTVSRIRDIIVNEYDVEPNQCERDLLELLQDLADKELIEIKNEASE